MSERILLIEDSSVQAHHLRSHLQLHGLRVDVISQGKLGLEVARQDPPDVIVLDIELPDMNGYDICRALKADPVTTHVPIIMLTMRDTHQDTLHGLTYGAVDYIAKDAFAAENLIVSLRSLGLIAPGGLR